MPRKNLDSTEKRIIQKAKTVAVKGTITEEQREILRKLIGKIGSNEQDVIGKVLTLWLYNEGFINKNSNINSRRGVR